jgi:DNA-binding response OmpR family regulator
MAHILLVEDDIYFADMFATNLEDLGHAVTRAPDGLAALNRLKRERFDLVITDFQMPFVNGGSLIDSLRRMDAGQTTPVILMSGALPADIVVDSLPIQGFLPKPFTHDVMTALVTATLAEASHHPNLGTPAAW